MSSRQEHEHEQEQEKEQRKKCSNKWLSSSSSSSSCGGGVTVVVSGIRLKKYLRKKLSVYRLLLLRTKNFLSSIFRRFRKALHRRRHHPNIYYRKLTHFRTLLPQPAAPNYNNNNDNSNNSSYNNSNSNNNTRRRSSMMMMRHSNSFCSEAIADCLDFIKRNSISDADHLNTTTNHHK